MAIMMNKLKNVLSKVSAIQATCLNLTAVRCLSSKTEQERKHIAKMQ